MDPFRFHLVIREYHESLCRWDIGQRRESLFGSLDNVSFPFFIGKSSSVIDAGFDGQIDEVRIWNLERTVGEIQSTLHSQLMGNESGLMAYYNFNQGIDGADNSGETVLNDLTSNALNGTLNNFTLSGTSSNWVTSGAQDALPNNPSGLVTTEISSTQIDISWTDNSFDETGFKIERSDGNNTSFSPLTTVGADITTYSDMSVTGGNGYYYRVIATNASGDSGPSNEKFGGTITLPGMALDFDGSDDFVIASNDAALKPNTFSIEAWIKPEGIGSNDVFISARLNNADFVGYTLLMIPFWRGRVYCSVG